MLGDFKRYSSNLSSRASRSNNYSPIPRVKASVRPAHLRRAVIAGLAVAAAVRVAGTGGGVAAFRFAPAGALGDAKGCVLAVVGVLPAKDGLVIARTDNVDGGRRAALRRIKTSAICVTKRRTWVKGDGFKAIYSFELSLVLVLLLRCATNRPILTGFALVAVRALLAGRAAGNRRANGLAGNLARGSWAALLCPVPRRFRQTNAL